MNSWIDVAGWTLVHFTWQGALAGAAAGTGVRLLRARSPQSRYLVLCAALAMMLAAPLVTARLLSGAAVPAAGTGAAAAQARQGPAAVTDAARPAVPQSVAPAADPGGGEAQRLGSGARYRVWIGAWLPAVVTLWLAGVAILLARLTGGWIRLRRVHRAALDAAPSRWEQACVRVAAVLGIEKAVRVVDSAFIDTPTVIGWMRPVVLMPIAALANLSPAQVDAILAHELAHIRRHDFVVNCVQTLAETLLFYHPAVWWLSARLRAEREQCCDLVAVSVCGDPVSYAEALAELETWRTADATLAVAATGGPLLERVRRLLGRPADDIPRFPTAAGVAAIVLIIMVSAGATHYMRAAQPEPAGPADAGPSARGTVDAVAWRMVFHHGESELNIIGYTARDLIRFAYGIPKARVLGGPRWLDDETSRIVVTLDAPPAADEMPSIVRQALEDRFQLQTHLETRDLPVYALVMARADGAPGPNLRLTTIDCFDVQAWIDAGQPPREPRRDAQRQPVCGEESWDSTISRTSYVAITMPELAATLGGVGSARPGAPDRDWPDGARDVVDRTGLTGRFDADIHAFLPAAALMGRYPLFKVLLEPLGLPSMETALERQLGLALEDATAPYDVIVVDSARRP